MYAERKQWPLQGVQVAIHFKKEVAQSSIERLLTLQGPLSDEQRQRLADIAERTPVTLTLKSGIQILTHLV
jgi:putative redox protein